MKTTLRISAVVILGMIAAISAQAQNMSDPSYSIHNYKHPNKSEKMSNWLKTHPVEYVEEVKETNDNKADNSLSADANYKNMSANESKIKKFRKTDVPSYHKATYVLSNGNYKSQFAGTTRKAAPAKPAEPKTNHMAATN